MRLEGKTVLVTGASRGIGREIARALARRGCRVALVARDRGQLEAVAAEIGTDQSAVFPADLAEVTPLAALVEAVIARFGRIDVLVNGAGIASSHDFIETDPAFVARTVDINFRAAAVLTRLIVPGMAARRSGHIVNMASLGGVLGIPGEATYSGTKAALHIFTHTLRLELGEHGIRLTDVLLGPVPNGMLEQAEANPRSARFFARVRRLGLLVDTPAPVVAAAVVRAIERRRPVLVLPTRARFTQLPMPGLARTLGNVVAGWPGRRHQ